MKSVFLQLLVVGALSQLTPPITPSYLASDSTSSLYINGCLNCIMLTSMNYCFNGTQQGQCGNITDCIFQTNGDLPSICYLNVANKSAASFTIYSDGVILSQDSVGKASESVIIQVNVTNKIQTSKLYELLPNDTAYVCYEEAKNAFAATEYIIGINETKQVYCEFLGDASLDYYLYVEILPDKYMEEGCINCMLTTATQYCYQKDAVEQGACISVGSKFLDCSQFATTTVSSCTKSSNFYNTGTTNITYSESTVQQVCPGGCFGNISHNNLTYQFSQYELKQISLLNDNQFNMTAQFLFNSSVVCYNATTNSLLSNGSKVYFKPYDATTFLCEGIGNFSNTSPAAELKVALTFSNAAFVSVFLTLVSLVIFWC